MSRCIANCYESRKVKMSYNFKRREYFFYWLLPFTTWFYVLLYFNYFDWCSFYISNMTVIQLIVGQL